MFKKFCLFSFLFLTASFLWAEGRYSYEYILNSQYDDATKTLKISPSATSVFNVTGSTVSNSNLNSIDAKTVVVNTKDVIVTSERLLLLRWYRLLQRQKLKHLFMITEIR